MRYTTTLPRGEEVTLDNVASRTQVQVRNAKSGQSESQAITFETGQWQKPPTAFKAEDGVVIRIEVEPEPIFIEVQPHHIERLSSRPDLQGAEPIELELSQEAPPADGNKPMKPLKPMKGMPPMKDMEPLEPLTPLK